MTLDELFSGRSESRRIFDALRKTVEEIGPADMRVTKSQVAFRRRIGFAWAWIPGAYLSNSDVPLVLTVALRRRDPSLRWKEVVEPYPGRFTNHLTLRAETDLDDEVRAWLTEAWEAAA